MEALPPLHPLWRWKLERVEKSPAALIRLCKSHLTDVSDGAAIVQVLDFVDDLTANADKEYTFTFEQFMVAAPFFMHSYVIQNKYYQSTTNKHLFSNSLQCKYACEHRMKMQINFQRRELILEGVREHSHEIGNMDRCHSWFVRSALESFARAGITSASVLVKALLMFVGGDLDEEAKNSLQKKLCLEDVNTSYAYNVIERVKQDVETKFRSIGQEFEAEQGEAKRRKRSDQEGQHVWRVSS